MGLIENRIEESIRTKQIILQDEKLRRGIADVAKMICLSFEAGGKLLLCGNGGSASDAMHLAAEFVGRFQKERRSLPAISLNSEAATLTSIANDYGYDEIFARSVDGLMHPEDVLLGISTSGNSENVLRGLLRAKEIGGKTVALLGKGGGRIISVPDIALIVPGESTARIQEAHIMLGHIICELVEDSYGG